MAVNLNRRSGILFHPTALPGPYGIGEIGPHAYRFIDNLVEMGQSLWQILPIGPTDIYNSPYSSISTFAGNHLLISLDLLIEDDLLDPSILGKYKKYNSDKISFKDVINFKMPILMEASKNFTKNASSNMKEMFKNFCTTNSYWLDDYSQYWALKIENKDTSWIDWEIKTVNNIENIQYSKIIQFIFHDHWNRLRQYCRDRGIQIIGDMPIYVGYDSSDVYANQDLFELDKSGKIIYQGGCPPCEYQDEGQLWGNPLYNWEKHEETNFDWWRKRFKKLFDMVDIIRLDHFIGYLRYYKIPIQDKTAHNGKWIQAPGNQLFDVLKSTFQDFNVIAEDLGDVTDDVIHFRDKYNFPGMSVLQFEMKDITEESIFPKNSVVCTGTHDNDTLLGWLNLLPDNSINKEVLTKFKLLEFFNCSDKEIHWEIINYAFKTLSDTVIVPMQDILEKASSSRFNIPGTLSLSNWSWRMKEDELRETTKNKLLELVKNNRRNPNIVNNLNNGKSE